MPYNAPSYFASIAEVVKGIMRLTKYVQNLNAMGYEESVYLAKLAEQAERYEGKLVLLESRRAYH